MSGVTACVLSYNISFLNDYHLLVHLNDTSFDLSMRFYAMHWKASLSRLQCNNLVYPNIHPTMHPTNKPGLCKMKRITIRFDQEHTL